MARRLVGYKLVRRLVVNARWLGDYWSMPESWSRRWTSRWTMVWLVERKVGVAKERLNFWTRWLQKVTKVQGRIIRRPGQQASYEDSALWVHPTERINLLPFGRQLGVAGYNRSRCLIEG